MFFEDEDIRCQGQEYTPEELLEMGTPEWCANCEIFLELEDETYYDGEVPYCKKCWELLVGYD